MENENIVGGSNSIPVFYRS